MKIICIGRNYIEHTKELNNELSPEPVFFLKPDTALLRNNNPFFYPDFSKEIHYETEIVLKISRLGRSIQEQFAKRYYNEIGIGIDFTARDLQNFCKSKGLPWEIAKAFDYSAAIGKEFIPVSQFESLENIHFQLIKNDKVVQQGCTSDMIFNFDKIISYVSHFVTLKIGDLIYTGTPAGVGPVFIGDHLKASIEKNVLLDFVIK